MNKLFFFLSVLIFITSCNNYKNEVIVANKSNTNIDSLLVYGNPNCGPLKFYNVKIKTESKDCLKNCEANGGDGSFGIEIYMKGRKIAKGCGYYSNGWAVFDEIRIEVLSQTNINIYFK